LPEVSWLFFKARAKHPYLRHTGRASNAEKQPTGPGPKGCDENGPAAALLVGHVSIQICSLLAPCRRSILIATIYLLFKGQDTRWLLTHWCTISGDSFRSSCQPWPYSKPTVSRRNQYGRIRWTWATIQKEYGEKKKLDRPMKPKSAKKQKAQRWRSYALAGTNERINRQNMERY
jgi:hypothetical protein